MKKLAMLALAVLAASAAVTAPDANDAFHFALRSSSPAADASVTAPEEILLTFTEAPEDNSVSVRLIGPSGDALEVAEPAPDDEQANVIHVALGQALAAGKYTVSWRGVGDDGHAVRGDFAFTVTAQ